MGKITSQMIARSARAAGFGKIVNDGDSDVISTPSGKSIKLRVGQHLDSRTFHKLGKPIAANIQPGSGISVSGQSGQTPTVEYVEQDGMMGVKITTAVGYFAEVSLPTFSDTVAGGKAVALLYVDDCTTLSSYALYLGDAGYANFMLANMSVSGVTLGQYEGYHVLAPEPASFGARVSNSAKWSVGGGAPAFGSTTFTTAKIRITPEAGKSTSVIVFGVWVNHASSQPRIVITADDGLVSQYTDMLPILEKYSLRASFALIADFVGKPGYMTLAQWKDLVARGHECVIHGPLGGAGSLQNYTTYDQILADVSFHRDYAVANGLARNGSERIYVYPQGKHSLSRGDKKIMQALSAAGFIAARVADYAHASKPAGPLFKRQLMMMNIVGHMYEVADEAGNVANVIARLQSSSSQGKHSTLMFHEFGSGTPASQIAIQNSNFESICAAINALETAGTAQNALLSELAFESLSM